MEKGGKKIILVVLAQIFIVALLGASLYLTYSKGDIVTLKIAPVDPRDLLRGDYMQIRFDISSLSKDLGGSSYVNYPGQYIYVTLEKDGNSDRAISFGLQKPKSGLFIKGKVGDGWGNGVSVSYGIEQYFIPEGSGGIMAQKLRENSGEAFAEVSLAKDGTPLLRNLIIGKEKF